MADIYMSTEERNNIDLIMDIAEKLPPARQRDLYLIGIGISAQEEKDNGSGSTNK